jgi:hypothetical protein
MDMSTRSLLSYVLLGIALIAVLIAPAFVIDAARYSALAAGVQAFGVVVALFAAATTLARDERNRRVDRVVAQYNIYQAEPIFSARFRLADHLSGPDGFAHPTSQLAIRSDPTLSQYVSGAGAEPDGDAERLLRFFEATNGMRIAGVLDEALTHRLLGRNILWWDRAIEYDINAHLRHPLRELAMWVKSYTASKGPAYTNEWRRSFERDFGSAESELPTPAE